MAKSGKNPKCSFFITKSAVEPKKSAFNAGVKEKNTKTNKITIVKNQKLATQNFLFNIHIQLW
jgi:hypothetical protein